MRHCAEEGKDEARAVHEASKNEDTPMSPDGSGTRRSKEAERSRGGVSDLARSASTFAKTMAKKGEQLRPRLSTKKANAIRTEQPRTNLQREEQFNRNRT